MPKSIRLNSTHYFLKKIPNKQELQKIAFHNLSDIYFKDKVNNSKWGLLFFNFELVTQK